MWSDEDRRPYNYIYNFYYHIYFKIFDFVNRKLRAVLLFDYPFHHKYIVKHMYNIFAKGVTRFV